MEMTSFERAMAGLRGEPCDVAPALNFTSVVTEELLRQKNIDFSHSHTDPSLMAQLAALGHTELGFDCISPYTSVHLEASALGSHINWGTRIEPPYVQSSAFRCLDDISIPSHFMDKQEITALLRAIKLLKRKFGDSVPVFGKVIGPWSLAYLLYGAEKLIMDMILKPEETKHKIQQLSSVSVQFAQSQFEAGASAVVWAEHCTSDLVSAKSYEEFVYPVHCQATQQLSGYGPLILHVCGNVEDRAELFSQTGFQVLHLDSRNNLDQMQTICDKKLILASCINNPKTLLRGDSQSVERAVHQSFAHGIRIIGPECAVPTSVSNRNLKALTKAAHQHTFRRR